jgi:hypothetical protein
MRGNAPLVLGFLLVCAGSAGAQAGQPGMAVEATPWLLGALQLPEPQPPVQLWDEFSEPRPQLPGNGAVAVQIGAASQ